MYQAGDYVMKINTGICRVEDISHLAGIGADKEKLYYRLSPLADKKATIYVSTERTSGVLRKVLSCDEAWDLIRAIPSMEQSYIENEKQREQHYREAVKSNDPAQLAGIIKTIHFRGEDRRAQGKKQTAVDSRYFHIAEEMLYSELAFAIGRDKSEIPKLIADMENGKGNDAKDGYS